MIVWRAIRTVTLAATFLKSLIAAGLAGMLLCAGVVNVGMTIGIMPTTGIPLPFATNGGSNTVANLVAVGLLCGIQLRGALPEAPPLADHELVTRRSTALRMAATLMNGLTGEVVWPTAPPRRRTEPPRRSRCGRRASG